MLVLQLYLQLLLLLCVAVVVDVVGVGVVGGPALFPPLTVGVVGLLGLPLLPPELGGLLAP